MALIVDTETDGISLIWTIQNLSFRLRKHVGFLDSPGFGLGKGREEVCFLRLCRSKKHSKQYSIGLLLGKRFPSTQLGKMEFVFSIRNSSGIFKKLKDCKFDLNDRDSKENFCVLKWSKLINNDAFFNDDTLTIRCTICKLNEESLEHRRYYARTIIGVIRHTYVCSLSDKVRNLSSDETNETKKQLVVSLKFRFHIMNILLLKEDSSDDKKVQIEIKQAPAHPECFVTCKISMLDGRKSAFSQSHEHLFENSQVLQIWKLLFNPGNKVIEDTRMVLKCEFAVSSNVDYNMIEMVELVELDKYPQLEKELDFRDSCKDDLKRFYLDGKLSDVTIRTLTKDFQAHKTVLCARSSVFCAMFECDMSENRTGVVETKDVDADTTSVMLLFLYTDTIVEDLEWDSATKLYYAADKYGITALRRRCSDFLQVNVDFCNVCELLVLADMHKDLQLKSVAQDFIFKHVSEVMGSIKWQNLMKDKIHLASEVMYKVCMKNQQH